jgi:Family of unknown function (DUF6152)
VLESAAVNKQTGPFKTFSEETIMKRLLQEFLIVGFCLSASVVPTLAHHSYQAEFDASKCSDIKGTLTKVDWDNPHIYFYLDVADSTGKVGAWTFEGHSLPALQRNGTHRVDFAQNIGKSMTVRACMAKNGGLRAAAETITTADGKVHVVGVDVEHGQAAPQDSYRAHTNN